MNVWQLMVSLRKHLEVVLKTLPLPIRGRDQDGYPIEPEETGEVQEGAQQDQVKELVRTARVYVGSMPLTEDDAFSSAPFVVLQPLGGHETEDGRYQVAIVFRLCIVCDDLEGGENDLQNLISLVRRSILSLQDKVIRNQKFRLAQQPGGEGLVPWERPDGQQYPFLQAHIYTTWETQGAVYGCSGI